jgi:predicted Zn-ribbon and HTH transcriptional regulator
MAEETVNNMQKQNMPKRSTVLKSIKQDNNWASSSGIELITWSASCVVCGVRYNPIPISKPNPYSNHYPNPYPNLNTNHYN